jgi:hypothetical protein
MGSKDDHLQLSTHHRVASLTTAKSSAERIKAEGSSARTRASTARIPEEQARSILESWPEAPQRTGADLIAHYGPPHEATPTKMFWYGVGPWSRMELTADEVLHNFPTPHTDYLTQYIKYPIDSSRAADLVAYDGSTLVDRTTGELGARCDHEAYNTLTINLAVEIMEGRRTVDEARELYAETAAAYVMGRDAPYAEGLLVTAPTEETANPDEAVIASHLVDQMIEKVKDAFGAGETPR